MFKKSMLFCCLLFTVVLGTGYAVKAAQPITVVFDGQILTFDVPPAIINDRTMVPMRVIFEAHGTDVHWDDIADTVTATRGNLTVVARIGDPFINVNGNLTAMAVAPVIVEGRTLVPVRFISEALGSAVAWDGDTRTVFITASIGEAPTNPTPDIASYAETSPDLDEAMFWILYEHLAEMHDLHFDEEEALGEISEDSFVPDEESDNEIFNQSMDATQANTLSEYIHFIADLAQNIVAGITNDEDRIRAVYDFMVLNFIYQDGIDGPVADGSHRPNPATVPAIMTWSRPNPDVPIFTIESGGFSGWPIHLQDSFVPGDLRNQFSIFGGYRLLVTGEGVCNCFTQLFNLLLASLGYETRYVRGSYINRDGTRLPHSWSAVRLDGTWYFFDTQVEASNLTRLTTNRTLIPYHWFRQPIDDPAVAERYVWDRVVHADFQ